MDDSDNSDAGWSDPELHSVSTATANQGVVLSSTPKATDDGQSLNPQSIASNAYSHDSKPKAERSLADAARAIFGSLPDQGIPPLQQLAPADQRDSALHMRMRSCHSLTRAAAMSIVDWKQV